jgi:hypothetical protein
MNTEDNMIELELDHDNVTTIDADALAAELAFREEVLSILQLRKENSDDRNRGKLDRLMDSVNRGEPGWQDQSIIKGIVRDIKRNQMKIKKAQQTADAEMNVGELITNYNFYIKASGGAAWYYQNPVPNTYGVRDWIALRQDTLKAAFPQLDTVIRMGDGIEDYNSLKEFNKKLVEQGRRFSRVIQSYNDQPNTLNLMHKGFCLPAEDAARDYHWMFDAVFESLSGGAPGSEEFEALQRTIWAKYLHPANTYIPNIVVCDVVGRGGKGLFSNRFLRRLFNGNIADNCNIDHVIGKFNSVVAGKAMIIVNETNRSKVDSERTKAFLGSPSILVEPKGMDVYHADNTALVMFVTNDVNGGVNVGGTKSDNRFSFFNVKHNIYTVCAEYMKRYEDADYDSLTELDIKKWIEGTAFDSGQNILHDDYEVGKWICAMTAKHGEVTHVEPHHTAEYQRIVDTQRGAWTRTVEGVFEDPKFEYIRVQLLVELVQHFNRREMLPGKNRMRQEIERLIQDRGFTIEYKDRAKVKGGLHGDVQRTVWRKTDVGVCSGDETCYGVMNDKGIWIWNWEF